MTINPDRVQNEYFKCWPKRIEVIVEYGSEKSFSH